jgi:hypothetical protein
VLVELDGVVAELRTAAFGRLVSDGQPGRSLPVYVEDSYAHPAPHPSLAPAPAIMPNPRMTTLEDVIE